MAGQIVTITLPVPPAGVLWFNLQFRQFGAADWTPYSSSNGSPIAPENIPIGQLVGGAYVIDGRNNPTGNMAAATAPQLLYQAAWVTAAGVTNWGRTFWQKRIG